MSWSSCSALFGYAQLRLAEEAPAVGTRFLGRVHGNYCCCGAPVATLAKAGLILADDPFAA